jgi:hypothetical protein
MRRGNLPGHGAVDHGLNGNPSNLRHDFSVHYFKKPYFRAYATQSHVSVSEGL